MAYRDVFKKPTKVTISGRISTIRNAFVSAIIPSIEPTDAELEKCFQILSLDQNDLRCAYCGKEYTEWDHLRPLVENKNPTGFVSEIRNLVPACGKCNQSKRNKHWRDWIRSDTKLSPKNQGVKDLDKRVERLGKYENWENVAHIDFENIVGNQLWAEYWHSFDKLTKEMGRCQDLADKIKVLIEKSLDKSNQ
jgi:hypothetical protein